MNPADASKVVNDAADNREKIASKPYTIADAIADAQWVERTPDGFMDPMAAKRTIVTLLAALQQSSCYFNAVRRGQATFVLVEQDRAAPIAIEVWAQTAEGHGCAEEKVVSALRTAANWRTQPANVTKWPT